MTDYDRGAYTPQTDAPLAFDPRRPSERRPMPMALIGSAAVLVILLAGVAMVYRGGVRHAGESPRPVGEPVMAVKTAPTAAQSAAAMQPANMDAYPEGQGNTTASAALAPTAVASNTVSNTVAEAPVFAAAAEQPAARPAPKPATVAMLSKPSAPTHIVRPLTTTEQAAAPPPMVHAKPAAANPVLRAAHAKVDESELAAAGMTRTGAAEDQTSAPTHKPAPVKMAATKPATVKTATAKTAVAATTASATTAAASPAAGKSVVQIGAFSSTALADKGYADVSTALSDRMAGKTKHVQSLDKDGATLYRTWVSGFAGRTDAVAFCEALKAKGMSCLVKG